jgi:hypothetical protein
MPIFQISKAGRQLAACGKSGSKLPQSKVVLFTYSGKLAEANLECGSLLPLSALELAPGLNMQFS